MAVKSSLLESFRIQFRVIHALFLREVLTRYGRHNIGFLWLFVEPMIFTLGVVALWTLASGEHLSRLPIVAFAVTGYSSVLLWRNMPGRCTGAIEPNLSLMYHRNVKIIDIFISRILLEFMGTTMSFIILMLVFSAIGWMSPPEDILKIILGWFMLAWFGASLAILVGAVSARSEIIEKIWHPATYLLFPLSGSAFMVDWLPPVAQKFVLYLPMVHGVEILREGYFGSTINAHYDIGYMAMICLVLTLFGLSQERVVSRQVTPE
jgi:capsular polysaccharide transport system permease protein